MNNPNSKETLNHNAEKSRVARKSTLVSVVVNIVLSAAQIVAGIFCASQSLIADGIHSLSDLFSDFVVLIANHHSSKSADDDHHYGHHRFETAASLFLGASLAVVGVGILWNALHKIIYPVVSSAVQIEALWVALFTLLAKEILFRYMLKMAKKVKSSMLIANAWHARSDAASSLVVAVSIIGSLMGYTILDIIGAFIVGLLITKTGLEFTWEALHDLMDRAVSQEENNKITEIVKTTSGVLGCHDLRTRKMGDMISMDIHIEVRGEISVRESYQIVSEVKRRVMAEMPVLDVMVHVDPV